MAKTKLGSEPEDFGTNTSENSHVSTVSAVRYSRRDMVTGGLSTFALTMFGAACGRSSDKGPLPPPAAPPAPVPPAPEVPPQVLDQVQIPINNLNFKSVQLNPMVAGDRLVLPEGYQYKAISKYGDPIGSTLGAPAFQSTGAKRSANTGAEAELQFGDNHDGLEFFPLPYGSNSSTRGLLASNHESARPHTISGFRFVRSSDTSIDSQHNADEVRKQKAGHGVSVCEIFRDPTTGEWQIQANSQYAFKVHADTPIAIGGPARGHEAMRTSADPTGVEAKGTLGNCGSGLTPWGTYLTCEEDSHKNYFYTADWASDDPRKTDPRFARYALTGGNERDYTWHFLDERFHVNKEPNETHRFGWVVEIDPYDPSFKPVKRTALGRFAHENCAFLTNADQRLAVYMGDDQGFDYVYKFVTKNPMNPTNREANRNLLDEGTLYVAKLNDDGTGEWLPLVFGEGPLTAANGFRDQGDVVIWARLAADLLGATQMDRPEWLDSDQRTGWVYACMSNNTDRGKMEAPGNRKAQPVNAANPRANNVHGHIIRWRDRDANVSGTRFEWELVLLAGTNQSSLANAQGDIFGDQFSSPDGCTLDQYSRLWISTDASDKIGQAGWEGLGNDMLLAMDTRTGAVKRFMVAPDGAEVCGIVMTADGKSLFVNIQHPGSEQPRVPKQTETMTWPDMIPVADGGIQRSATVVITKKDGGIIGL